MYFSSSCGRKSSRLRQSRLDSALGLPGGWSWCGAKSGGVSAFATTSRHGLRTDDWGIPIVGHLQIWILVDIGEYVCIYNQQYYMGIILDMSYSPLNSVFWPLRFSLYSRYSTIFVGYIFYYNPIPLVLDHPQNHGLVQGKNIFGTLQWVWVILGNGTVPWLECGL